MADKRRFLDVWIIEANTVYKEVPFTVVTDWIQQGRLLEDDMLKPSGTKEWQRIGGSADFSPYLPRALPQRVDDKAEALEPVEIGFSWKRPREDEDEEVDMIPLIDVTLVLLIFFMITAVPGASAMVDLPEAHSGDTITDYNDAGIAIDVVGKGANKEMRFSLSMGNVPSSDPADQNIQTAGEALARLQVLLDKNDHPVTVTINGHKDVRASVLLQLMIALEKPPLKQKVIKTYRGVTDLKPS
jgi:biopolymer transport protein ExbD